MRGPQTISLQVKDWRMFSGMNENGRKVVPDFRAAKKGREQAWLEMGTQAERTCPGGSCPVVFLLPLEKVSFLSIEMG